MNPLGLKILRGLVGRLLFSIAFLFSAAGSFRYQEAWLYLLLFFTGQGLTAAYLLQRDPDLLSRRLKGGAPHESRPRQKVSMAAVYLAFALMLLIAGFDHRCHWSHVPAWLVILAEVGVVVGLYAQWRVFKENTFASIVIKVVPHQRVISSGPYALVRHPMYAAAMLTNLSTPIALGSWWALTLSLVWFSAVLCRILDEEQLLRQELPGYSEYCQKVRYRLVPLVL